MPYKSGIYTGYHRAVFVNKITEEATLIILRNGRVYSLGYTVDRLPVSVQSIYSIGYAEHPFDTEMNVVYTSIDGSLERQKITTHATVEAVSQSKLGEVSTVVIDNSVSKWYFYYSGTGDFGNGVVVGHAPARLLYSLEAPTSAPSSQPTSHPSPKPTKRPTIPPSLSPPTTAKPTVAGTQMYFTIHQVFLLETIYSVP